MEKDFLIKLTNELYRITLLFPKRDPLRHKIRDLGTDILANFLRITNFCEYTNTEDPSKKRENCSSQILEDLEILESYLEVAKAQNWVSPEDIFEIKNQYSKLKQGVFAISKKVSEEVFEVEPRKVIEVEGAVLKPRQKKLLEILAKQEKAQVKDLKREFPNTSKRTLRRDLRDLLEQGMVERMGVGGDTFYKIKKDVQDRVLSRDRV